MRGSCVVKASTQGLFDFVKRARLETVRADLDAMLRELPVSIRAFVDQEGPEGERAKWFHHQVVETARDLGYFANKDDYHAWVRLVLENDSQGTILVSFHTLGREYAGVIAVSACFFRRVPEEGGSRETVDLKPLSGELFQLNDMEPAEEALERLDGWLDGALAAGLDLWRRGL